MLTAFHGSTDLKIRYLTKLNLHRSNIVQNIGYWNGQHGCAVGVTINGSNHGRYESELGLPVELSAAELALFDTMNALEASLWPIKFIASIPVGSDTLVALHQWLCWLLRDVATIPGLSQEVVSAIQRLAMCFDQSLAGQDPRPSEWSKVMEDLKMHKVDNAVQAAMNARGAWAAKIGWRRRDLHEGTGDSGTRADGMIQVVVHALRAWSKAQTTDTAFHEGGTWDSPTKEDDAAASTARRYAEKLIELLQLAPLVASARTIDSQVASPTMNAVAVATSSIP